jgi:hypothetical protein
VDDLIDRLGLTNVKVKYTDETGGYTSSPLAT